MAESNDRSPARIAADARRQPLVVELDDLEPTRHAHEFVGADHGDVPFSIILARGAPRFDTEWLAGDDPAWTSTPREP